MQKGNSYIMPNYNAIKPLSLRRDLGGFPYYLFSQSISKSLPSSVTLTS
jgi:hypothetical protein